MLLFLSVQINLSFDVKALKIAPSSLPGSHLFPPSLSPAGLTSSHFLNLPNMAELSHSLFLQLGMFFLQKSAHLVPLLLLGFYVNVTLSYFPPYLNQQPPYNPSLLLYFPQHVVFDIISDLYFLFVFSRVIYAIINMTKPIEGIRPRVNSNVDYGLQVATACQLPLQGIYEKSLHYLLTFAVKLKLL